MPAKHHRGMMATGTAIRRQGGKSPGGTDKDRASTEVPTVLPPLEKMIGYKLRRAQLAVFQDFLTISSKMRVRPTEFSVLALMAETPGRKQTEIAERLGIKRANFVTLMDGLEKRGLAERRKVKSDRRSHSLHLTPEGQHFIQKVGAMWAEHENRLTERLGGHEEKDRFIELLDRISAASRA